MFKSTLKTPGFAKYYRRLQCFLLFFIDGAAYLNDEEINNPFWEYYVTYKRKENGRYVFAGFYTVYNFHRDINTYRKRISQCLVLPPYQR